MKSDFDWQRLGEIPDPFATASARPAPDGPSAEVRAAMGPSPARGRVRSLRVVAFVVAIAYEAAAIAIYKPRPDMASLPPWQLALGFLVPAAGALLAFGAAVRDGERGLGESPVRLRALTLGAPTFFVLATWIALPHLRDPGFWTHAFVCMLTTAVLGSVPVLFAAWVLRRSFVAAAGWRAAAMGVACGALAATAISLVCASEDAGHILVGHGTAMLVLGLLGAIAGGRLART
ncbi:MAG TPA: NrsF family protein [Polyangiaceae bacterium]|jgi:hypothetical protein|nr:NrsF family protein [Polyangiaceae bacterium]